MRPTLRLSALAVSGLLTLAACGGGDNTPTVTPAAQASTTVTAATAATVPATTATTAAAAGATTTTAAPATTVATVAKVNANTASRAELTAAITAAGVSNADRWTTEVVEYRPYPTNDPTFAKLRQNLVKYNPGPGVVDGIISALSL
jgi:DNA uptake protein ComE-like DNA-binding protein